MQSDGEIKSASCAECPLLRAQAIPTFRDCLTTGADSTKLFKLRGDYFNISFTATRGAKEFCHGVYVRIILTTNVEYIRKQL